MDVKRHVYLLYVDVKHHVYLLYMDLKHHVYLLYVDVKHHVYLLYVDLKHHVNYFYDRAPGLHCTHSEWYKTRNVLIIRVPVLTTVIGIRPHAEVAGSHSWQRSALLQGWWT